MNKDKIREKLTEEIGNDSGELIKWNKFYELINELREILEKEDDDKLIGDEKILKGKILEIIKELSTKGKVSIEEGYELNIIIDTLAKIYKIDKKLGR